MCCAEWHLHLGHDFHASFQQLVCPAYASPDHHNVHLVLLYQVSEGKLSATITLLVAWVEQAQQQAGTAAAAAWVGHNQAAERQLIHTHRCTFVCRVVRQSAQLSA